jgi:acetyl esterase/lipase
MKREFYALTEDGRVHLTAYLHDISPELPTWPMRPAVLVLPGGGYGFTSDREADPIALAFLAAGFHAFVLRYSVAPHAAFPNSLCDASRAMQLIRRHAAEWGVDADKIAVCGFSAGGHLAASLGTLWNDPEVVQQSGVTDGTNRPNALILMYPVITAGLHTHGGSIQNLCAGRDVEAMRARLSCELNVGPHTPPSFLFHTFMDNAVPVENSLLFASALARADVPFELHIYPNGVHGLALANALTANCQAAMLDRDAEAWLGLCVNWLWRLFGQPAITASGDTPPARAKG